MNLRKIDRLVAEKVMGWKDAFEVWGLDDVWITDEGEKRIFNPTTEIADAWQVVEKLKNTGDVLIAKDFDGKQWEVEITIWQNESIHKHFVVKAETAPLAICLAALKVKDVNIGEENKDDEY